MQRHFSTSDLAKLLGVRDYQVRRLFANGVLPECEKIGHARVVPATRIPEVVLALKERGCLPVNANDAEVAHVNG